MKTRSIAFLTASLLALGVSQSGFAQDDSSAQPAEADTAAEAPHDSTPQDSAAQEQEDAPAESDEAAAKASAGEDASDAEGGQAKAAAETQEPKVGPGGKELRDDYPGTEEAKKARMDTDRIEGLSFEEGQASGEDYDVRIRELETRVDDLKEKVFRSKSRIVLLKETVLTGNLAGSRAILSHENDLGGAYVLKRAHFTLDGSRIFNETDRDGSLSDKDKLALYNGSITPGNHRVSILLELQGTGYGLFSYMDDYKFTIKDSCDFSAQEGRSAVLKVRLIDRGGAFSSYEDRPGIECVLSSVKLSGDGLGEGAGDAKSGDGAVSKKKKDASAKN